METKCNEEMDSTTNMDTNEKMMSNDEEFSDDFAQNMSDFENNTNENEDAFERFQAVNNRGNFRFVIDNSNK